MVVFDRRRRDPIWKLTEKLSGEDKVTDTAVNLFYEQIDALVKKRFDAVAAGYKYNPEEDGADLLDLFMQSTNNPYQLGGMAFAFLIAGRKCLSFTTFPCQGCTCVRRALTVSALTRRHNRVLDDVAGEGDLP